MNSIKKTPQEKYPSGSLAEEWATNGNVNRNEAHNSDRSGLSGNWGEGSILLEGSGIT